MKKSNSLMSMSWLAVFLSSGLAHGETLQAQSVGDFGGSHASYPAQNAFDGNTAFASRWAASLDNGAVNLYTDFGSVKRIDDVGIAWGRGDQRTYRFEIRARAGTSGSWTKVYSGTSSGNTAGIESYNVTDMDARQVRVKVFENSAGTSWIDITEFEVYDTSGRSGPNEFIDGGGSDGGGSDGGGSDGDGSDGGSSGDFGLDPNKEPWENFDLSDWVVDTPAFASDGESERFGENKWDEISNESRQFFYTHTDGGMRFKTRLDGAKTSSGTSYVRSELREMLRAGDTSVSTTGVTANNWRLGYQPGSSQDWGGTNGKLTATLKVNQVTTSGSGVHVGRTIIGQIHASKDEPVRLYYHKYPGDSKGCIYLAHEIRESDDIEFDIIGNENCNNPSNGIALDELFSYEIINTNEDIRVIIRRGDSDGPIIGDVTVDMNTLNSGYDRSDEWMYFKLGAYTQNNRGNDSDGDIITFYRLSNTHD